MVERAIDVGAVAGLGRGPELRKLTGDNARVTFRTKPQLGAKSGTSCAWQQALDLHGGAFIASRTGSRATDEGSELAVAGGVAGLALFSEVFQMINTGIFVLLLHRINGSANMAELAALVINYFRRMGWPSYFVYAALLITLQVLPLMSALLFIILAGAIFGPVVGTALVSTSLSIAAVTCCLIGRTVSQKVGIGLDRISPSAAAIDEVIGTGKRSTLLLLLTLLRLSPIVPFTFSNYMFGLTSIPPFLLLVATFAGTLPSQAAYVTAGALGKQALSGNLRLPTPIIAAGAIATVGAIVLVGRIAQQTLQSIDVKKSLHSA
eukprot:CAMPEP_0119303110 /NCGR_PEP_ID=MMETSP1333-20130426/4585_1 /TAXON_ID=418940 /ORGANISM="Scyphosphaera apsteinii, Strain RCC1455" /LENGTH=320 /DNA_ID=CAMNT_0007305691 /DNA_START=32 /DNA_END=995 /DNA_ORIENTATION=+